MEPISKRFAWLSWLGGALFGALSWTNLDGRGFNFARFETINGPYGWSTFLTSVIIGALLGRVAIPLGYRLWPFLVAGAVWAIGLRYFLFPNQPLFPPHYILMTVPVIGVGLIYWLFWSGRIWSIMSNVCGVCGGSGRLADNQQCYSCLGTGDVKHSGAGFFLLVVLFCGFLTYMSWRTIQPKRLKKPPTRSSAANLDGPTLERAIFSSSATGDANPVA
jgi:hypothetical protein